MQWIRALEVLKFCFLHSTCWKLITAIVTHAVQDSAEHHIPVFLPLTEMYRTLSHVPYLKKNKTQNQKGLASPISLVYRGMKGAPYDITYIHFPCEYFQSLYTGILSTEVKYFQYIDGKVKTGFQLYWQLLQTKQINSGFMVLIYQIEYMLCFCIERLFFNHHE